MPPQINEGDFDGMDVSMNFSEHNPPHFHEEDTVSQVEVRWRMCMRNPDYDHEIYMVEHHAGPLVDCYFTNGDIRRYDITPAVSRGGVYAPLADENVVKKSLTVYKGTLAFDLKGNADPFEIIDFCPDTVYEKSESVLPLAQCA